MDQTTKELVEALKYLIQDQPGTGQFDRWWEVRVQAARAAIAKATGEADGESDQTAPSRPDLMEAFNSLLDVARGVVTAYGGKILPTITEEHLVNGAREAIEKAEGVVHVA